jgi:hypothetical protein
MKRSCLKFIFILSVCAVLISCKYNYEEPLIDPLAGLTKLKEGYAIGASAKIELWGTKNFFVGYNNLVVVLYDSLNLKEKLIDAHIHFMPLMTMGMGALSMQQSCPMEDPEETAINNVFPASISFIMPSDTANSWKLSVMVHNHKINKEGEADFDISVDNPLTPVLSVFPSQSADHSLLVLSLIQPIVPKAGINVIEFTIYHTTDLMYFPPDNSYTIEIKPEIPTTGIESSDNVNPVNTSLGHYMGKVNFTMKGEWHVNVLLKKDGVSISNIAPFTLICAGNSLPAATSLWAYTLKQVDNRTLLPYRF